MFKYIQNRQKLTKFLTVQNSDSPTLGQLLLCIGAFPEG